MIHRYCGNERMHQVVAYNGLLFLSGQTFSSGETIEAQGEGVLQKIDKLLIEHGSDKDHILSVCVYLRDMALFSRFNAVYDQWVSKGNQPTRCCIEARMATEKHLVEIVVIAAQKEEAAHN